MNEKLCKHCGQPISRSKRTDAIYCSPKCGSDYRNKRNAVQDKEKRKLNSILNKNYKIIKELYRKGILDVSVESLELLEFDIELFTGFENIESETKTSIVRLYEFQLKFQGGRCQIKKLLI